MSSLNKVMLIGHLGRAPECRSFADGTRVANLNLATTDKWRDKQSGDIREATEWHRVSLFGRLVDVAEKYLDTGSQVYIEGSLRTRKWQDKDGQDRYSTEVVLSGGDSKLILLSGMDTQDDKPAPRRGDDDQIPF
jgi:single-strand DNA-binding protein